MKACVQVVSDLPRFLNVAGHFHPAPFFLTDDMFGGLPFSLAGGHIKDLVDKPVAETHVHEVPEIYLLLSPEPAGAEIEIQVDEKIFRLISPAAFYVPAFAKHKFVTKKAQLGSYCFGILLNSVIENSHERL